MKHYLRLLTYLNPYRFRLGAAFVCALLVAGLSAAEKQAYIQFLAGRSKRS